jgi:hypothetical protein
MLGKRSSEDFLSYSLILFSEQPRVMFAFKHFIDDHRNCAIAAEDLLLHMNKVYGDGIFKAVVESHDSRYVE